MVMSFVLILESSSPKSMARSATGNLKKKSGLKGLIKTTLKLKFVAKLFRKNERAVIIPNGSIFYSNSEVARYHSM